MNYPFKCTHTQKCTDSMVLLSFLEEGLKQNEFPTISFRFHKCGSIFSHITAFSFMDFIGFELKEPWSNSLPADNLTHIYTHSNGWAVCCVLINFIFSFHMDLPQQTKKENPSGSRSPLKPTMVIMVNNGYRQKWFSDDFQFCQAAKKTGLLRWCCSISFSPETAIFF